MNDGCRDDHRISFGPFVRHIQPDAGAGDAGVLVPARIWRWGGIPTRIGIAPTKTLTKLVNHIAKTDEREVGSYPSHLAKLCHWGHQTTGEQGALLAAAEVREIWLVGSTQSK